MKIAKLTLTQMEFDELNAPYSRKEAYDATITGFAKALSESGISPAKLEDSLKTASVFGNKGIAESIADGLEQYGLLGIGVGALGGAALGSMHHNIDQAVADKDDPKVVEFKRKIDAYKNMSADLRRSNRIGAQ